ncbi:Glutathionylspermidine synthase [Bryocella elongata]|uniref:Glutathionylspermidine synthase n=1 Tax=Bryocella elongata TaxID=863522 RepID=A0A1H5YK95_9BACT|nr:glutathionylspermidine synthase family protein [Bryocella elongata]SEG24531.1 Glutathionylspermidine synthase [Bryocella elongata]
MQRHAIKPRDNWQATVEAQGLTFHTPEALAPGSRPYWDESACYEFTSAEVDQLEAAANTLQEMCLAAAQKVIDEKRYEQLEIPAEAVPMIEWAWEQEPPALYGRFDVLYNGSAPPKLLEYNADTPTSLLEAAVVQWYWLEDVRSGKAPTHIANADQFNSLHERLIAKWKDIEGYLQKPVYFASADYPEDLLTVAYLRDTAEQAGIATRQMLIQDIGWNDQKQAFVDTAPEENAMRTIFKLYPWETMMDEAFASECLQTYKDVTWIEPIWKMLLSNKGLLPVLWEMYPGHELLLEAKFVDAASGWQPDPGWVRKPMHSREGQNLTMVTPHGKVISTEGPYTDRRQIDQRLGPAVSFRDPAATDNPANPAMRWPVLGLWMIDQECGGMGIREDAGPITGNLSSFVPHLFRG